MTRQSRKKRKRNRRRIQAEAIARGPKLHGGWGHGVPVSRSDLLLVRKAIHENWAVPARVKDFVMLDIHELISAPNDRMLLAVARTMVATEAYNQRLDLAERFQSAGCAALFDLPG